MPHERFYWERWPSGTHAICDRTRQPGERAVATADDQEMAARIVRLLNADLERTERQGAVVP